MRTKMMVLGLLATGTVVLTGCPGDEAENNSTDTGSNNPTPDAGGDTDGGDIEPDADGGDVEPDADGGSCTPRAECPVDTCGQVDDGCGGTLDCGSCACDSGVALETSCGLCGFGERICGDDETGAGTCSINTFAELGLEADVDCERVIYVDPAGANGGNGSATSPYNNLPDALSGTTSGTIAVAFGTLQMTQPVTLVSGVHILGGFDRSGDSDEFWSYDPSGQSLTTITVRKETGDGDIVGMLAIDITDATVVSNIDLRVADARNAQPDDVDKNGASSIGLMAKNASGLTLINSEIQAGKGGDGKEGGNGTEGAAGVDGADGTPVQNERTDGSGDYPLGRIPVPQGAQNASCDAADGPSAGGDSGQAGGACSDLTMGFGCNHFDRGVWNPAFPVSDGQNGEGSLGGAGATSVRNRTHRYPTSSTVLADNGEDGRTSNVVADNGDGGTSSGMLGPNPERLENVWVSQGEGSRGDNGVNGGGGGGGGSFEYVSTNDLYWFWGSQGGSGGSGGCAGTGGFGGGSGGASIGALLIESDVRFINTQIESRLGGSGGDGGTGGVGATGGRGGLGASQIHTYNYTAVNSGISSYGAKSGNGGGGGRGTTGGNGGGGAGGVSYGVYCTSNTEPMFTDTAITAGGSANGGDGNNRGEPGLSQDTQGCL